jgi:lipopolysaccharide/colanic/teichoic acid biosynthesis glycosyltransferase
MESNILSRSHFLNVLRIEKRRVERSKAPFSIALFSLAREPGEREESIHKFLSNLLKNTRETDIKGWIDRDVIGLLLPDTNEIGLQKCVEKIANGNGELNYSVSMGTYPDQIFQKLLIVGENPPDFFPLELEEPKKYGDLQSIAKRLLDIVGSFFGLLLFSPVMLLTALAIKVNSPGSIVFRQSRVGRKGRRFQFYKFRSMYSDVDNQVHREYVASLIKGEHEKINQGDEERPLYKMKSDPRVTPVGRIIRKTSIDELPQFLNVLKGDMSLVGPRPPLPYEVEKYEPWHLRRILEIKPGITGLWQVDGRSKTSFDDMVRLDLRYAQNWSLSLDVKILLRTPRAVIRGNGAA